LLGPLRPSGMERMLVSAAPFWPEGSRHVVIGQGDDHPFRADLEAAGYRVVTVPPIRSRDGVAALSRALSEGKPDLLHVHTEGAFFNAVRATRRHVRVVRTVHNILPVRGRRSWSRKLQSRLVDRYVDVFIAPSSDVASNEAHIGRECTTILNWVGQGFIDAEPPSKAGDYAIIVGNSSPIKNHVLALEAVLDAGVPLAFVGDESGASTREREILAQVESEGRLLCRGVRDPLPWLLGAGVFLMPSRHEGMGVALAEALQMGVPALIADAPGLRWAASIEGVTALPYERSVWARAILEALGAGHGTRGWHPDFSPARGATEYTEVYSSVVRTNRPGKVAGERADDR